MIINKDYKDQLNVMHAYGKFGHRGSKIFKDMDSFLKKYQQYFNGQMNTSREQFDMKKYITYYDLLDT
jgi:hypothetical protein